MARFGSVDDLVKRYTETLHTIVKHLDFHGYVVTIEQVPNEPLAMGNYSPRIAVREARSRYASGPGKRQPIDTARPAEASDGAHPGPIQMLDEG
jgi:hypothetical protein